MVTGGNNAEAAIVIRAVNEASDELNEIQRDTEETSEALFGFSRNAVTAGIAALGLSFGLKEALEAGGAAVEVNAQTDAILRLLGPEVEAAFRNIEPLFGEIGNNVGALSRDVEKAALVITQNAGGIVPVAEQLAFAFDLAAATGTNLETAAAAVGQAMQGNLEPLNALLDPSGRSYITLAAAMEALEGASRDAESGFDKLQRRMQEALEDVGSFFDELLKQAQNDEYGRQLREVIFGGIGDFFTKTLPGYASDVAAAGRRLATGLWDAFTEHFIDPIIRFFTETLPDIIGSIGGGIGDFFGGIGDFFGISNDTGGGGGIQVIINGDVDSAERASQLAREIHRQMRESNRRGVNVSAAGIVA